MSSSLHRELAQETWKREIEQATIIAVMGMTGSGKSTFIHKLTNSTDVEIGDELSSCTLKPQFIEFDHKGRKIVLMDTPGFDDTFRTDADVLQDVAEALMLTYSANARLSGIIYLHRIIDPRITHGGMRNLEMFRQLCGRDPMRNILLTTTFWDQVDLKQADVRLNDLRTNPDFWGEMLEEGAQIRRFDNTFESALRLVLELDSYPNKIDLRLQQELSQGMTLEQTSAGGVIHDELQRLTAKHNQELMKLRQELADAHLAQDYRQEDRLQRAFNKHEHELKTLQAQQARLRDDRRAEVNALERHFYAQIHDLQQKNQQLERRLRSQSQIDLNELSEAEDDEQAIKIAEIKRRHRTRPPAGDHYPRPPATRDTRSPIHESKAEKARRKRKRKQRAKKAVKITVSVVGVGAAVAGIVLNPMLLPNAIHGLTKLLNMSFSDETDPEGVGASDGLISSSPSAPDMGS